MTTSEDKIRIVFWGTAPFAVPLLRSLAAGARFELVAVVTKPDEPAGRKQTPAPPPIKTAAEEMNIPILQPKSLKDAAWVESYSKLRPHVAVVAAYGKLIPEALLEIPRLKTLNVHPSLLPKYRGASPVQAAIANGDGQTGVSVMLLDAEMDHGPILAQEVVPLTGQEIMPELETRLAEVAARLLPKTILEYAAGDIKPAPQAHAQAIFTKIITRDDGRVDWSKSAAQIERLHRAYRPWPGLWAEWRRGGKTLRLKLLEITVQQNIADTPGKVLSNLTVACGSNGLQIVTLQPEGKKEMSAEEFLRGHPQIVGTVLS